MSRTNSKPQYVFTHVNPDTDGVTSSIAYADWRQRTSRDEWEPVLWGNLNPESSFVLGRHGVATPQCLPHLPPDYVAVLVDTHHPRQLPAYLDHTKVVEIIDHHPGGSPHAFPNASVQNEEVGAAGTLLAERYRSANTDPPATVAALLSAAIVSNTLNFKAPSTTERDCHAANWLGRFASIDQTFIREMMEAASNHHRSLATLDLLESDYKEFEFGSTVVGISQLETAAAREIVGRSDLRESLTRLRRTHNASHVILNVVDVVEGSSTVIVESSESSELVEAALGVDLVDGIVDVPRVLQRKTDFVPKLADT